MRTAAWLVGLLATVLAGPASADNEVKLRRVRIAVSGTTAQWTLGLSLRLDIPGNQQQSVERGWATVVTGGSVTDAAGKHPMILTRVAEAQAALDALTAAPANKRAMGSMIVLGEPSFGPLTVDVRSPRAGVLAVELQLEGPTCFDGDTRYVAIRKDWVTALEPALRRRVASAARTEEVAERCDRDVEDVAWIGFPDPKLARRAPGESRIGVTVARFADGKQQAARVELAIANALDAIPLDLHTAIVLDTSISVTSQQREAAQALVRSYLSRAPRTAVQVIAFARNASPLLARWTNAATVSRTITKQLEQVDSHNGSEIQPALREAGAWLSRIEGTRRVVLITDERVADRVGKLSAATLAKELPPNTLVHVIALASGDSLTRDDTARWSTLAAATEGMAMRCGSDQIDALDALPLVRPISLDHVRISAPSWKLLEGRGAACTRADDLLDLAEGDACTWWGMGSSAADTIDVDGMLWGHRFHQTVALGDRNDLGIARQLQFVLDAAEPLAIAALDAAMAISSRWSLVARWGGAGGYAGSDSGGGTGWGSVCGCGDPGTIGHGYGTGSATWSRGSLRDQLAAAVATCAPENVAIALTVETTFDEIVDVVAIATARSGKASLTGSGVIETCVQEAVWNTFIHLTPSREHETAHLTY